MRLVVAVETRPDVIRIAPLLPEFARAGIQFDIAFSGDSSVVNPAAGKPFYGLPFPEPKWMIETGAGTDARTTGAALAVFENLFSQIATSAVLVVGDSNTMLAAAISAARAGIPVVHLEAGLRCGDMSAPDEVNRVLVSRIAAMHLTPSERALETLEDEGIEPERIHFVGASGAEAALKMLDAIALLHPYDECGLTRKGYVVACIRRTDALGDTLSLTGISDGLGRSPLPVLMPDAGTFVRALAERRVPVPSTVHLSEVLSYPSMLACVRDAAAVVTDCGSLAEEACVVGVPCVTLGSCTRQVATITVGANELIASTGDAIEGSVRRAIERRKHWVLPKRWDRAVSDRIIRALRRGIIPLS